MILSGVLYFILGPLYFTPKELYLRDCFKATYIVRLYIGDIVWPNISMDKEKDQNLFIMIYPSLFYKICDKCIANLIENTRFFLIHSVCSMADSSSSMYSPSLDLAFVHASLQRSFFAAYRSGCKMPPEIIKLVASWRVKSVSIYAPSGTMIKNPCVGLGVIGI